MYPAQPGDPGTMVWTTRPTENGQLSSREAVEIVDYWRSLLTTDMARARLCAGLNGSDPQVEAVIEPDGQLVVKGRPSAVLFALRHSTAVQSLDISRPLYT